MIILGLHFGHDAAATVIRDGQIVSYALRERFTRVKHAATLDLATVHRALRAAAAAPDDLDAVAVCSTQSVELIVDQPERLRVKFDEHDPFGRPCLTLDALRDAGSTGTQADGAEPLGSRGVATLLDFVYDPDLSNTWLGQSYARLFPEHVGRSRADIAATPWQDTFAVENIWEVGRGFADLAEAELEISDRFRYGFHVPVRVELDGHDLPGYAVHHHLAHAAGVYFMSGFSDAAVLTHDGWSDGRSYHSGMYYYGKANALYPLAPHHLNIGALYDRVGVALGLGVVGAAGKLMGLAAYGRPRFVDTRFLGNHPDLYRHFPHDVASSWLYHCRSMARRMGYDLEPFGDPARATAPINVDIAASTQRLFELIRMEAVRALHRGLARLDRLTPRLCLSGGTALNCPSNSDIAINGPFADVFVEPACDDGGIAVGAALAVHHSILDLPVPVDRPQFPSPYRGSTPTASQLKRALAGYAASVHVESCQDAAVRAGADLADDLVIGWFEGGSELGPRALGHRSILADPRRAENWPRVNQLKQRELWRPFAPAVLAEHAADWFRGVPLPSPYMLFNAQVAQSGIPAVTHADGTARIQTVDENGGGYRRVIEEFHRRTAVPVVLNTSFNGPGEPIVESPDEALAFFVKSDLDVLYIEGHRVTRR